MKSVVSGTLKPFMSRGDLTTRDDCQRASQPAVLREVDPEQGRHGQKNRAPRSRCPDDARYESPLDYSYFTTGADPAANTGCSGATRCVNCARLGAPRPYALTRSNL